LPPLMDAGAFDHMDFYPAARKAIHDADGIY
jgi:hypothetical protein